jgi:xyloglucan-specific exo-beta-1,4-glucanase
MAATCGSPLTATDSIKAPNSGTSFTKLANVTAAYRVAFGRAAPAASHPAVFIWGTVSGVAGFFRSDDAGLSWVRINDDLP